MSCTLAIYDRETEYANHLMDYIKRKQKKLTVRVFTNPDSLREYSEQNPIQILLINENMPVEEIRQDNIENICILSEDNDSSEKTDYPTIYKFQSAENLMKELFSYYPPLEVQKRSINSLEYTTEIISVFSICEGAGRSVFSFSLAKQYAALKKTLYVNLDIIQVLPEFLGHKADKDLSEFIYFLKQNPTDLISKMNSIILKRNNLDYIEGVSFGPDLHELTADDINLWLREIIRNTDYEAVVFDVGCFFHAMLELFRNTGKLLLLLGENSWEQARYNNFINQLDWAGYEDITEKITAVPLPAEERAKLQSITANNFDLETDRYDLTARFMEI